MNKISKNIFTLVFILCLFAPQVNVHAQAGAQSGTQSQPTFPASGNTDGSGNTYDNSRNTGNNNNGSGLPQGNSSAKGCKSASCIRDLLTMLQYIMFLIQNYLVSLIFSLALIFFLWNVTLFIRNPGDAAGRTQALSNIGWSIGALFMMFALYGIIAFISNTTGIGVGGSLDIPRFQLQGK